jgi:hypothetical protein
VKLTYDRQSVAQSVLMSGSRLEPMTRFLFSVWQLQVSCCGAPSLTRGWVCNLLVQLLLGLARTIILGSNSRRTKTIFYRVVWDSPNLEGQVPVFICPRNRVPPVIPPGTGYPFCRLLRLAGLRWRYSNPPPHESEQTTLAKATLLLRWELYSNGLLVTMEMKHGVA